MRIRKEEQEMHDDLKDLTNEDLRLLVRQSGSPILPLYL